MVNIESLGGPCPVQAYGTIDGVPFYFRARGSHWGIAIGENPVEIYCNYAEGWRKVEKWSDDPFEAGWMEDDEARKLIHKAAEEYRKGE